MFYLIYNHTLIEGDVVVVIIW